MGNRAVLAFTGGAGAQNGEVHNGTPCVYLHWNGGHASVAGFLAAARALDYHRLPTETARRDAVARMVQAWFGNGSVYVGPYFQMDADNWDNGTYVLNARLEIVERRFTRGKDEEVDAEKTQQIYLQCLEIGRHSDLSAVQLVA